PAGDEGHLQVDRHRPAGEGLAGSEAKLARSLAAHPPAERRGTGAGRGGGAALGLIPRDQPFLARSHASTASPVPNGQLRNFSTGIALNASSSSPSVGVPLARTW